MVAPPRPSSAFATLVSTLNSSIASGFGNTPMVPNWGSLLSTPSSEKLLFVGRKPFTEIEAPADRLKRLASDEPALLLDTETSPCPNRKSPWLNAVASERTPTYALETPGVRVASCVKLRSLNGK